jgi:RHS repeat-associated protein
MRLYCSNQHLGSPAPYPLTGLTIVSPTQLIATIPAESVPPGVYTVQASLPDNSKAQLVNAFTMVPGGKGILTTNLILPNPMGYHIASTIYVEYSNTGDAPLAAPLLVLSATDASGSHGALMTLDESKVVSGFWTSAVPDGYSNSVQLLASGATAGLLQPGESVRVPVYYAGWQLPWGPGPFTFSVGVLDKTNTTTIDWNALKDSLRPPSINAQAWDPIFSNLVSSIGNTWGSYVAMLDNNAAYLGQLGQTVTDVSQLWNFQVQQAIGFSTVTHLADTVDAQVTQPGLPLTFGRFFTPSLVGRYQLGVLGWGWTWSGGWQRTLTVAPDGTVTIADTDGSQRRFQPDTRGGYFAQAGDHGILQNLGSGIFSLQELDGQVTRFGADGRVDYIADPNGNKITAGYTGSQLTSLTHSAGQALQIHYNNAGRIDHVTDSASRTTTFTYDPTNQYLLTVQTFDGRVTHYTYDQSSDPKKLHALLSVENPGSAHLFFGYDAQGRLNDMHKDGSAEQVTFTYGPAGRVAATDAALDTTQYFFDDQGLLAKLVDPLQNAAHFAYDNAFNLTQLVDPSGQQYTYQYDGKGNLIRSTDPLGNTVSFAYAGPYDRLMSVTDARGSSTHYAYDAQGNPLSITYADNSKEQFKPDAAGDPVQWTNRRGTPIQYQRDSAGRVQHVIYADGSHVDYKYDDTRGTLQSATDASGTTTLLYEDPQHPDRVTKIVYPGGRYLAYQYNDAGLRGQMADQGGFIVKYHYDAVGRLDKLLDGSNNVLVSYTYYPTGLLKRKDNANGTYTTYEYAETGQIKHLINYSPSSSVSSRFDYTYDSLGRTVTEATLDGTWTYNYDAVGELTHAVFTSTNPTVPSQDLAYAYDAAGNRTQTIINSVTTTYTANSLNEYTAVGNMALTYDADGNLISTKDNTGSATYTYDDQSRLVAAATPDGNTWAYQYDPFGNRVASTQNGQKTLYLIDPAGLGSVVGEYNATGSLIDHYTTGLGLASRVDAAGSAAYYDFDAIGSTAGLTGPTGGYVNTYRYLPFGESLSTTQTVPNPFRYDGQAGVATEANGLTFMHARYYASGRGQFLSEDPLGLAGGLNLHAYAVNNPVDNLDPSGLSILGNYSSPYGNWGGSITGGYNSPWLIGGAGGIVFGPNGIGITVCASVGTPGGSWGATYYPKGPTVGWGISVGGAAKGGVSIPINVPPFTGNPGAGVGSPGIGVQVCYTTPPLWCPWCSKPPTPPATPTGSGGSSSSVNSTDPNDKIGPAGYGPANFVPLTKALPYRIDFENDPKATAPAQRVDISDQLSSSLDGNTFQLTEVAFGDNIIAVPANSQHFQTSVPMTYNNRTFVVLIDLGLDAQTGLFRAYFQSLDPATSLPPDVLTGFLPPEDGTGRGMAHVSYTVQPKAGLPTGTLIKNVAQVTFDLGETIATNQVDEHDPSKGTDPAKEARVTIDAVPPISSVNPLPADSPPSLLVTWSATDDPGGSGVGFYDIYLSDNGGPFVPWLVGTPRTQGVFGGNFGHTYAFYSVATDNAGNREPTPTAAQATTVADLPANVTHFRVVPPVQPVTAGTPFSVTVTVLDAGNNVVPGYSGTVTFASSDPLAGLPADYPFTTDDKGVHTFTVTLNTPGSQTLTVTDTATPGLAGQAATVTEVATKTAKSQPSGITAGPDGNMWFTEYAVGKIGRITPAGVVTEFSLPTGNSGPSGITAGPDGNLWFTETIAGKVGRITPAGVVTELALPTANSGPTGITTGPDGNLWFTEATAGQVGVITPDGNTITEYALPTPGSQPTGITAGPDGNLWFTEAAAGQVGLISPDGSTVVEFPLPTGGSQPTGITVGPDGNLWFTEAAAGQVSLISPDGSLLLEFPIPTLDSGLQGIAAGPDGNLWFTETYGNQVGRLSPDGSTLTEFLLPTANSQPAGLAFDANGTLWLAEAQASKVGQLIPAVLVNGTAAPTGRRRGGGASAGWFAAATPAELALVPLSPASRPGAQGNSAVAALLAKLAAMLPAEDNDRAGLAAGFVAPQRPEGAGQLTLGGNGAASLLTLNGSLTQPGTVVRIFETGDPAAVGDFDPLPILGQAGLDGILSWPLLTPRPTPVRTS